jgi:hypothetical protein
MSAAPRDDWFIEIQKPKEVTALPERIDCYVLVNIDPKCCGALAKDLNAILPLRSAGQSDGSQKEHHHAPITDHLKRIRRRPATAAETDALIQAAVDTTAMTSNDDSSTPSSKSPSQEAPKKRAKKNDNCNTSRNWSLDMLVGSIEAVDDLLNVIGDETTNSLESILAKYNMTKTHLTRRSLPGRPAETKDELQQWNTGLWPTLFFEKKTDEYKEEEMQLSKEEQITMLEGMNAAIGDALVARLQWAMCCDTNDGDVKHSVKGVIVLNPQKGPVVSRDNGSIVSRGCDERQLQAGDVGAKSNFPDRNNPMCTSTILALQGVSRNERENALGHGMESAEFLCTG